jgi:hypothetical protein
MRALGAPVPVVASVRVDIPFGPVMPTRPLCVNAPTSIRCDAVVATDAVRPFEFRVIAPALACTGWTRSTPEYARTDPTAPVDDGPVKTYSEGSALPTTRTKSAWASGLDAVVHAVWTTVVQPAGAEIAVELERNAIAATSTCPLVAALGRGSVRVCDGVAVPPLVAVLKVGVAAGALPSSAPPSATTAAAADARRRVLLGTRRL